MIQFLLYFTHLKLIGHVLYNATAWTAHEDMYLSALQENYALAHRDRQYSVVGRHDITGETATLWSYVHEKVARPLGRVVVDGQVSPFDVADQL
jgi:hypothetical protein